MTFEKHLLPDRVGYFESQAEQLSFLEEPDFMPLLPPTGSDAELALDDLCKGPLTQIDWLNAGKGWRLSAAIKQLDYLGWQPLSVMAKCNGWSRAIARYSLPAKALQAAYVLRKSEGAGHAPE